MKRSGRIQRHTPLRSGATRSRKPRSKSETVRVYGTPEHQAWLRALGCLGCARVGTEDRPHHLHHTRNGGMGRKADASSVIPLCDGCHWLLHQHGPETFERAHADMLAHRTLRSWAETYAHAWEKWCAEPQPLSAIVPQVHADLLERSGA